MEQLHVAVLSDEFAVLFVKDQMFAGPILEFRVHTVTHDEYRWFLVVVDAVTHVDAHEHGVLTLFCGDDEVFLVFELNYPWCIVH